MHWLNTEQTSVVDHVPTLTGIRIQEHAIEPDQATQYITQIIILTNNLNNNSKTILLLQCFIFLAKNMFQIETYS